MADKDYSVDSKGSAYLEMEHDWALVRDLMGGTTAMRNAGETWLPREPKEDPDSYTVRKDRSFLYEAYPDTVDKLAQKPFIKPVTIQGELPERIGNTKNVDNSGNSLTNFAKEVLKDAIDRGLTHLLIDFPKANPSNTRGDEKEKNINPYFTHVKAENLIGFKWKFAESGEKKLSQIRIHEKRIEEAGSYGEQEANFIRVINETSWELYKKSPDDKEYWLWDSGINTFGEIPLITFYTNRTGFMKAKPALMKLAWLNLAHWQSYSDQRNILRFARVGILFAAGFTEDELKKGVFVGPKKLTGSTNPDAKLEYVEHSGKAIEAGEKDLQKLEERMEVVGLQPLMSKGGDVKATGQALGEMKNHSSMQSWVTDLEDVFENGYKYKARWVNLEESISEEFKVDIFSDFIVPFIGKDDSKTVIELYDRHLITGETTVKEVKRRGTLSEVVDPEKEVIDARAEQGEKPFGDLTEGDDTDDGIDNEIDEMEEIGESEE
jgi:hypothetical protein